MRRYLLGELSESEQSALEEKYFSDPEVFNQVLNVESELADGYARDQLSAETRERVERYFMAHPARAERVKFAVALTKRIDESVQRTATPTSADSWWHKVLRSLGGEKQTLRFALALILLMIVLGGIWVFVERGRRQQEAAKIQAAKEAQQKREREQVQNVEDERKREAELAAESERLAQAQPTPGPSPVPTSPSPSRSVSLVLAVGGVRGGNSSQIPTLVIPRDVTQVQLRLNLKSNDFRSYSATLQTVTGDEILRMTDVKPTGVASFAFTVPANKLESGDYVLALSGVSSGGEVESLSKSLFRVVKK